MKIKIDHQKNAVLGWDIDVSVEAGDGQKIAQVDVRVNDIREVQDEPDGPLDSWEQQLTQKGIFPGKNKVEVVATDQNGDETSAEQQWS